MRIISGSKRGKKLFTPTDDRIRPTADRAREALFSILYAKYFDTLDGVSVADIFSGTGAIGLEAASRGAASVLFVDVDLKLTKKNAAVCGFSNLSFMERDARRLPRAMCPFGLIFLDAPYNKGLSEPVLEALFAGGYVDEKTLIVVETAADEALCLPEGACLIEARGYGAARFSFLKGGNLGI
ncbi:MAG: RsmD family RNA methyltransferase [Acetobacter sp.]|nr:RsmD family RNA methyltransferase [Acetobacter sp.]